MGIRDVKYKSQTVRIHIKRQNRSTSDLDPKVFSNIKCLKQG